MTTLTADGITCSPTDCGELQNLVRQMIRAHGRCRVVEVGTWLGHTALAMLEAGAEVVHCVDTWEGTDDPGDATSIAKQYGHAAVYNAFRNMVGDRLHNGIEPHVGRSVEMAKGWPAPVELVFIDADHRYGAVRADIDAWTPHVCKGGILAGHDFPYFDGVAQAVKESGAYEQRGNALWVRRM